MRILFASPDRDLLECCKNLFENDLGETVTAFDGTQVLSLLSSETFDAAVLDCDIPRIGYGRLIACLREKKIPVIALISEPVSVRRLTEEPPANAYLRYPFTYGRIKTVLLDVLEKASSENRFAFCGLEINVKEFKIGNGPYLTAEETDVLQALATGKRVSTESGVTVDSLNVKLARTGSKVRIGYVAKKGYETVNENE